eukprot:NODE_81_length_22753_cov_0.207072.p9 type:complete len:232 gc:universal NODE_81_length_22753_cov_0.207072:4446-5141(+)
MFEVNSENREKCSLFQYMTFEDEDDFELNASTQNILMQFLKEKELQKIQLQKEKPSFDILNFQEDWNLSQFWYNECTARQLAEEASGNEVAGFISSPSAYMQYKKIYNLAESYLFEFDERFSCFEDHVHYDYKEPYNINEKYYKKFDVLVIDPPFLSEECFTKTMKTATLLAKANCKFIICTGKVMEPLVNKLAGAKIVNFEPRHENGLSNDFSCFLNYESKANLFKYRDN